MNTESLKPKMTLPIDEIIDRLYHRQEPELIVEDLIKRNKIQGVGYEEALLITSNLKIKIESFRVNP